MMEKKNFKNSNRKLRDKFQNNGILEMVEKNLCHSEHDRKKMVTLVKENVKSYATKHPVNLWYYVKTNKKTNKNKKEEEIQIKSTKNSKNIELTFPNLKYEILTKVEVLYRTANRQNKKKKFPSAHI